MFAQDPGVPPPQIHFPDCYPAVAARL